MKSEARCMYCGCWIADGSMESDMKNGLYSEYCEDCLKENWREVVDKYNEFLIERDRLRAENLALTAQIQQLSAYALQMEAQLAEAKKNALEWITYDGSEETLPEIERKLIFKPVQGDCDAGYASLDDDGHMCWCGDSDWWYINAGDTWAYLPEIGGNDNE